MNQLRKLRQFVSVQTEYDLRNACASFVPVRHRSRNRAIFHTCVWKTASQWVRVVLTDPRLYMYCGLKVHIGPATDAWWPDPGALQVPRDRIVPNLYCAYDHFAQIRKPEPHAVFFVQRDPRDILVSWYYSNRYSHAPMGTVDSHRRVLSALSERDGIAATVDCFDEIAKMLRSWRAAADRDPGIRMVRYEDLTGPDALPAWLDLLAGCDVLVPREVLRKVLDTYSFQRISGGRKPGQEDRHHKYRKGVPGDWQNHFDGEIARRFHDRHGDLAQELGYD